MWTLYRRNYFDVSAAYIAFDTDSGLPLELLPSNLTVKSLNSNATSSIQSLAISISAVISGTDTPIRLMTYTAKRDNGPRQPPGPKTCRNGGMLPCESGEPLPRARTYRDDAAESTGEVDPAFAPSFVKFSRVQFKQSSSPLNPTHFCLRVELMAKVTETDYIRVARVTSAPLCIRGKSPGTYNDNKIFNKSHLYSTSESNSVSIPYHEEYETKLDFRPVASNNIPVKDEEAEKPPALMMVTVKEEESIPTSPVAKRDMKRRRNGDDNTDGSRSPKKHASPKQIASTCSPTTPHTQYNNPFPLERLGVFPPKQQPEPKDQHHEQLLAPSPSPFFASPPPPFSSALPLETALVEPTHSFSVLSPSTGFTTLAAPIHYDPSGAALPHMQNQPINYSLHYPPAPHQHHHAHHGIVYPTSPATSVVAPPMPSPVPNYLDDRHVSFGGHQTLYQSPRPSPIIDSSLALMMAPHHLEDMVVPKPNNMPPSSSSSLSIACASSSDHSLDRVDPTMFVARLEAEWMNLTIPDTFREESTQKIISGHPHHHHQPATMLHSRSDSDVSLLAQNLRNAKLGSFMGLDRIGSMMSAVDDNAVAAVAAVVADERGATTDSDEAACASMLFGDETDDGAVPSLFASPFFGGVCWDLSSESDGSSPETRFTCEELF
ncbi:hypothetical protein HDU97_000412 [Phlyctochytrium planicorne]|nr:hypothetical protein HDU97_000412 [Phlyctochytrium planicorne]